MSSSEYRKNAIKITKFLKFPVTEENIDEAISAIMTADYKHDPTRGKLSTIRVNYVYYYIKNAMRAKNKSNKRTLKIFTCNDTLLQRHYRPEKDYSSKEFLEYINKQYLTKKQKRILQMRFWESCTLQEMADREDTNIEDIRTELNMSLRILKDVVL